MTDTVFELRRYTLKPGARDTLIGVFDSHLVETQEAVGMSVVCQFRDPAAPDQFVWFRGFPDQAARTRALPPSMTARSGRSMAPPPTRPCWNGTTC
ncbi:MAG: hypothetical protein EOP19_23595 [Hyphomicrobiales bacterium]|nr:MAG: hypothetical protein EOP19_23595 [Hyphomicrobiales bacterium]